MKKFRENSAISVLLMTAVALLSGCSSITRPPPAAAYMDSYGRNDAVRSFGFSYYAGDLDNAHHESEKYNHTSYSEWWGDATFANYISGGYFTFGWGFQTFTPFLQGGFVSPYFGLNAWSNTAALATAPMSKSSENGFMSHYSGGGMAIEQIPLNDKWKLGFTEHLSRNGREVYFIDEDDCFACGIPSPRPKFYMEAGGGFYVSRKFGESAKASLEFRYGRDMDENRNRFSVTLDIWGFTAPLSVGGNDVMRSLAQKNIEKMKHMESSSVDSLPSRNDVDSLHTIKRNWFRLADSNQTVSFVFHPVDSVTAVTTKGICYDERADVVWMKQDYGNMVYKVSADSLDYCQQMERKSLAGLMIVEGALIFLPGALITGSATGGALVAGGTAISIWALFNFGFDPENLAPKVYPELCSERHTKEQVVEWLRQYPCGSKLQSQETGN